MERISWVQAVFRRDPAFHPVCVGGCTTTEAALSIPALVIPRRVVRDPRSGRSEIGALIC